jgi:ABC-type uncharacterized transport system permease subunit
MPDVGDRFVMVGLGTITKSSPLLDTPPTVTTTYPVVALFGTVTPMFAALQLVTAAVIPLKLTVLDP